ncbi:MAG: urea amidolyase associated protein UAAP1 [Verrucomicrobiota bacterium]
MKEPPIPEERLLFEEDLPGGWNWSHNLKRGTTLRLTALEDGANVSALFYNADQTIERYNMADTLKAQHVSFLTAGVACYSDMGRILVSVMADSCGWHDTIGGVSNARLVERKYGLRTYQEARNDFHRNGLDAFLTELAKYGMDRRDVLANINFFSKVAIDGDGIMRFVEGHASAGDYVDLRAEMNTLVVLNNLQHPMDPRPDYAPAPTRLTIWQSDAPGPDDACRTFCEQNGRGFINTERYFL